MIEALKLILLGAIAILVRFTVESSRDGWTEIAEGSALEDFWRLEAEKLGLLSPTAIASDRGLARLSGNLLGFATQLRVGEGIDGRAARIEVAGGNRVPADLELGPEPTGPQRLLSDGDVLTGDTTFDGKVWVTGDPTTIMAIMDSATRRLVQRFTQRGGTLGKGTLSLTCRLATSATPKDVLREMRALTDLAQRLEVGADAAARLARNALGDPVTQVRARCLELLAERFATHDVTRSTLRSALSDRDPLVRTTAACRLGPEGRPVLLAILAKAQTAASTLALAVRALGAELPPDLLARLLRLAGARRHPELAQAVLEALPPSVGPEVAGEVLGFVQTGPAELQPLALATVGRIGSVALVLDLRAIANDRQRPADVRRAARDAIAMIQARSGAAAGDLALADGGAGTVSLATGDGRVSLPEQRHLEPD